ncbi:hypothetical protein DBR32_02690 [Taibaiella sp. KBW10]|uniref:T9SS type A sorting domain-containing protein n=1 Tax=Taibaiella sp. KBW10 TaxID=2153357 RepID=UPI000F591B07|nr:T9SS type A sorting domain-containing protein [Taibaiella sp. KBW10]RQO32526.1 hypothetical protein DBR32_02690 [Taibaiella sp. KBW10]
MLRKIITTICLLLLSGLVFGQTLTNMSYNSSFACTTPSLPFFPVTVTASAFPANPSLTAEFAWGDGTPVTPVPIMQSFFTSTHNYSLPGVYTVTIVLKDGGGIILDTKTITVTAFCNLIKGNIFKSNDANCTYDVGVDEPLNLPINLELFRAGTRIDAFTPTGFFYNMVTGADLVNVFTLQPAGLPPGYMVSCPPGGVHAFKFDTLNNENNTFNYALECDGSTNFDLEILSMRGLFRPVANSYIYLYVGNRACLPTNGIVTIDIDPQYTFSSANIAPLSVAGNTVTWMIPGLSGSKTELIRVVLDPVGAPPIGGTVTTRAEITPRGGDVNPANNELIQVDPIVGSFDPNEKSVLPAGDIRPGELLTYTINFENLGNDTAFNIHVLDTLSPDLDLASYRFISSSHAVSTYFAHSVSGLNIIKFDFANIRLGDINDPEHNKGYVKFQIKARGGLAPGTTIGNTAHIYFDINPAVVTNTTINQIPQINELSGKTHIGTLSGINIYPNPASNIVSVENGYKQSVSLDIVNTIGQVVRTAHAQPGLSQINLKGLSSGTYFVYIKGLNNVQFQKLVIQ